MQVVFANTSFDSICTSLDERESDWYVNKAGVVQQRGGSKPHRNMCNSVCRPRLSLRGNALADPFTTSLLGLECQRSHIGSRTFCVCNERAHDLARRGAISTFSRPEPVLGNLSSYVNRAVKNWILWKCQSEWSNRSNCRRARPTRTK